MQPSSNFSPDELNNIKLNYSAYTASHPSKPQQKTATTRKKPGGAKGFLQGLIPLAGGALGALAGIPLGPAGIIAGGAAGSSGGELLKQKLQGGPIDKGDVVEQGLLGAIPGLGSGFKALRAGGSAASLIGRGGQVASEVVPGTVRASLPTKLYNKGVITEARSGGFGQGEKVTGGETLGFRDSEKIANTLAKEGVKGASPSTRQIAVGDKLEQHAKTIDAATEAGNKAVDEYRLASIIDRVQGRIIGENGKGVTGFIPGNKAQMDVANNYVRQLADVKDAKGLLNFKRSLDQDAINYGRSSLAPDPVKEQIAKAFRQEVNKDFGKLVPEAKAANESYSALHDANELLKQAARDSSNSATQPGGSIFGRALTSDTAVSGKSKVGRGMQSLGKLMGAKTGESELATTQTPTGGLAGVLGNFTAPKIAGAGIKQAIPRGAVGAYGMGDEQPVEPQATTELPPQPVMDPNNVAGGVLQDAALNSASQAQTYSREAMLSDIQRDPKNASTYLSLYKELAPPEDKGLNSTASGVVADTTTGLQALQQLGQKIGKSNANSPGIGQLRALNPYDTTAQNLQADIATTRQIVGKALEGGVLRKEDEVKYKKILPTVGDTDAVAQYKIQALVDLISGRLSEYKNSLAGGDGGAVIDPNAQLTGV